MAAVITRRRLSSVTPFKGNVMNSSASAAKVNSEATWEAVESWVLSKGASGEVVPKTAQLKAGAVRLFAATLRDDEPKSYSYVLENLEGLARRWMNLNQANQQDTARTYMGRARWALEMYAQWEADPISFRFPDKDRAKPIKGDTKRPRRSGEAEQPEVATEGNVPKPTSASALRSFPLGDGREIVFGLPDGLTIRDLRKFFFHVVTFASDFDPSEPGQSQLYTLARRD